MRLRLTCAAAVAALLWFVSAEPASAQASPSLTLVAPPSPCGGGTPNLGICLGAPGTELAALRQVACLLDALNRWRLEFIACTQKRIDDWQGSVMWPRTGRRAIGVTLGRVRTLREEAEAMADSGWLLSPATATLASTYTSPVRVDRGSYDATWGASTGTASDVQDLLAWHSAHTRNLIQARTSAAFGLAGELPENTWERIGRETARVVSESETDALAALRYTPQLVADRLRVETSTTRLQAQALATLQLQHDYRRLQRRRAEQFGTLLLDLVTRPAQER